MRATNERLKHSSDGNKLVHFLTSAHFAERACSTPAPTAQHFSSVPRGTSLTVFAERACTVLGSASLSLTVFSAKSALSSSERTPAGFPTSAVVKVLRSQTC